ncbi:MAG: hypothetical protein CMG71_02800 [Candidatus Marinimicrobia bacterium]|nr:hypothetical protein [Candidatus Neomarinimicrobiota bacterium]|tara:strand:- start:8794 stop:9987 length:1194 start_codon:yes stop_codon:yes gene_type:complete
MKFHNRWLIALTSVVMAQSPYNAVGYGIFMDAPDAASLGFSSTGLIPSMDSRFSPGNPTTWTDLVFTYLSGHYSNQDISSAGYRSGFGTVSSATFIIPINGKYSLGLGMAPVSRKVFNLVGDTTTVVFSGDTLTMSKSLDGSGGISTLFGGGACNITENHAVGARFDFLFGVYDEHTVSHIDYRSAEYARRFAYKGTFLSAYYRFVNDPETRRLSAFASFQFPFGNHYIARTDFFEFISPDPQPRTDFVLPTTLSGGVIYRLFPSLHAGAEIVTRAFNSEQNSDLNSLEGEIGSATRFSVGLAREKVFGSRDWLDWFHYRVGFFTRSHYIDRLGDDLTEVGYSLGLGIPFGLTQNQLDFGIRVSKRQGFLSEMPEAITQLSVGLTLGDLWLVKGKRR